MKHTNHKGLCPASMMKAGNKGMQLRTMQSPAAVRTKPRKIGGR